MKHAMVSVERRVLARAHQWQALAAGCVLAVLATGCRSARIEPPETAYGLRIEDGPVRLEVHAEEPPDGRTEVLLANLEYGLRLLERRVPRGLEADFIDVYLLTPQRYTQFLGVAASSLGRSPENIAAFVLTGRDGSEPDLYVSLPSRSAGEVLDAIRLETASFQAVHELTHAWLARGTADNILGPSEEGICNWIAGETLDRGGGSQAAPATTSFIRNDLAIFDDSPLAKEEQGRWRVLAWAKAKDEAAYAMQPLYWEWLYRHVQEDDAAFRRAAESFQETIWGQLDRFTLGLLLDSGSLGEGPDDPLHAIATLDEEDLEGWLTGLRRSAEPLFVNYSQGCNARRLGADEAALDPASGLFLVHVGDGPSGAKNIRVTREFSLSGSDRAFDVAAEELGPSGILGLVLTAPGEGSAETILGRWTPGDGSAGDLRVAPLSGRLHVWIGEEVHGPFGPPLEEGRVRPVIMEIGSSAPRSRDRALVFRAAPAVGAD